MSYFKGQVSLFLFCLNSTILFVWFLTLTLFLVVVFIVVGGTYVQTQMVGVFLVRWVPWNVGRDVEVWMRIGSWLSFWRRRRWCIRLIVVCPWWRWSRWWESCWRWWESCYVGDGGRAVGRAVGDGDGAGGIWWSNWTSRLIVVLLLVLLMDCRDCFAPYFNNSIFYFLCWSFYIFKSL